MTARLRAALRRWAAATLRYSGLLRLLMARRLRQRAVVFMYHRVLPATEQAHSFSAAGMFVTPETFERHVRFLRRRFNPVTLGRFIELLESGGPFPPRTCLITFDDGWRDNLQQALPILRRHGVPATVFVTSGVVGNPSGFWQERLMGMLFRAWEAGAFDSALRAQLGAEKVDLERSHPAHTRAAVRGLVTELKQKAPQELRELIERVASHLQARGIEQPQSSVDGLMSWDEVRQLRDSGVVDIGSHCESHIPLTQLPPDAVRAELAVSRTQLERETGGSIVALAFPNGDNDPTACNLARACGYRVAFTTQPGAVAAGDDPLRLRRVSIHEGAAPTISLLLCRAAGVL